MQSGAYATVLSGPCLFNAACFTVMQPALLVYSKAAASTPGVVEADPPRIVPVQLLQSAAVPVLLYACMASTSGSLVNASSREAAAYHAIMTQQCKSSHGNPWWVVHVQQRAALSQPRGP